MYFRRKKPNGSPTTHEPYFDRQFKLTDHYAHPQHKSNYPAFLSGKWRGSEWTTKPLEQEEKEDKARKSFGADFAASVATGLVAEGYMDYRFFLRKQLENCRNTILNLGFDESSSKDLRESLHKTEGEIIALVPGCQDSAMLERRVNKFLDFTIDMHAAGIPFSGILSGRCPKAARVQIANEAIRMYNLFEEGLTEKKPELLPVLRNILPIAGEHDSSDTIENVDKFFACETFTSGNGAVNIVAISSTFHLIRLSRALETKIKDYSSRQGARPIGEVFLIGAEDGLFANKQLVQGHFEFIKLMMFDLYAQYAE